MPAGSLPRTMEVIFRNDIVEQARAGDKLVFSGSLVVVPDVSVITAPGQRSLLKGAGEPSPVNCTARPDAKAALPSLLRTATSVNACVVALIRAP